jgi:glycosyltransferase involved in cell wall biosynthesis
MKTKSIIILNDFCYAQGGASRVAIDEAIALQAAGSDVYFLGAVGPICPELRESGVSVTCLDQPELASAGRHPAAAVLPIWNQRAFRATQRLLALPLHSRQTIVHLHGYSKALSVSPILAARRAGFATVCTLHDFYGACPNGAFYDYRLQAPCQLRALSVSCVTRACDKRRASHKLYRVLRGVVQRYAARFPAGVSNYIVLSRRSAALLQPYLPPASRLFPMSNIIDVPRAPPVDPASNQSIAVVGRLDEEKGAMLAAEAAARLGLSIVFVGDGPLRDKIEATGARVTGWVPATGVHHELNHARCLVFPSRWYETFGLVVTEAAARGVPSIVSDVSAPADRVTAGRTGWVFRAGDVSDLVAKMRLTQSDELVRSAGLAAYQAYWAEPANPELHAKQLLSIYDAVLSDNAVAEQAYAAKLASASASPVSFSP